MMFEQEIFSRLRKLDVIGRELSDEEKSSHGLTVDFKFRAFEIHPGKWFQFEFSNQTFLRFNAPSVGGLNTPYYIEVIFCDEFVTVKITYRSNDSITEHSYHRAVGCVLSVDGGNIPMSD